MPEHGYYEKLPRPESRDKLLAYLQSKAVVSDVEEVSYQVIHIHRPGKSLLKLYLTNIYIVGLADVYEILTEERNINAIVTMSAWNGYTSEAKQNCKDQSIGLFTFTEILGAVYYDDKKFFDYTPPK